MQIKNLRRFIVVLALLHSTAIAAAGDPAAGKAKAASCAGCHGADGNSTNPAWPKLAGQHAGYIAKQLADMKAGEKRGRTDPTMGPMAAALSEQDMADLGAYFESLEPQPGKANAAKAEVGAKLYRGGNADTGVTACMACHGPRGSGNPAAGYPALSGQHAAYTVRQLELFRAGKRKNDPAAMMQSIAARMSDAEIKAVAEYIAGLH